MLPFSLKNQFSLSYIFAFTAPPTPLKILFVNLHFHVIYMRFYIK